MKKIIRRGLLFLVLLGIMGSAKPNSDIFIIERILLCNSLRENANNTITPGDSVEVITNKDEIIYYSANIGVINSTKEKYGFKIICVDSKNNIIFGDTAKVSLYKKKERIGKDSIRHVLLYLRLDPEPGAIVEGRLLPWENDNDYYIKLYFENKLMGVTKFHYMTKK